MVETTGERKTLFQLNVDIDFAKNPNVREMFNGSQANREVSAYLKAHDIHLASTYGRGGSDATHIELKGSPEGLESFIADFLSEDDSPLVYDRLYRIGPG